MNRLASCVGLLVALTALAGCSIGGAVLVGYVVDVASAPAPTTQPAPAVKPVPAPPPKPAPEPEPVCPGPNCPNQPKPKRPPVPRVPRVPPVPPVPPVPRVPRPWGPRAEQPVGCQVYGERDGSIHDGHCVQVDLPCDQLVRNCGGSDGVGLCVFTAIMFSARLQNVPQLKDFQAWMKKHPGGGWPQKVDQMIAQMCKEKNVPIPDYIQIENGDWDLVKLALKTGRTPSITYGSAHMTNIVCLDGKYGAFRDNNFIGADELDWMTEPQAKQKAGGRHFWAVVLLAPRPPMPPRNNSAAVACAAPYVPGRYEWKRFYDAHAQWALWRNDIQIGAYDADLDLYGVRPKAGQWGPWYRRPPVRLPPEAMAVLGANAPGGVRFRYEGKARYSRGGAVISRREAFAAVAAPKLEDDSKKLSLTVIGEQKDIDAVRAELVAPANAIFAANVIFQGYLPSEWAVDTKRFGFAHDGQPTIYLQRPDGTVLLHLRNHDAETFGQLRKKDPSYDPNNDPGIKKPSMPDALASDPMGNFLVLGVAGAMLLVLLTGIGISGGFTLHLLQELWD